MEEAEHLLCKSKLAATQQLRCAMRAKDVGDTHNPHDNETVDFGCHVQSDVAKTSVVSLTLDIKPISFNRK